MDNIGLGKWFLGICVLGFLVLAIKPLFDITVDAVTTAVSVTDAEATVLSISFYAIGAILLIWLCMKLVKRNKQ